LWVGEWAATHLPDATICVSETLSRELALKHGRHVEFIPNGVSLIEERDDSVLDEHGLEPRRYVLFASRLVPEKGCHYLIEAWRRGGFDMPLVMAGESSFSDEYVARLRAAAAAAAPPVGGTHGSAEAGRESLSGDSHARIVFPGYVYGARLASLFENAALFVLPSDLEGMPIVLLEALGYGTPVLASDIPPNREVLGRFGRTFKAGSVEDLRGSLADCLGDIGELRSEAQGAREVIKRDFDWNVVTSQTVDVYEMLEAVRH
jgi:glycosyltransferase involved in cell wall biosynthesis